MRTCWFLLRRSRVTSGVPQVSDLALKVLLCRLKKYGIPSSTLHNHVHDTSKQIGAGDPTVLQKSEVREIAVACVSLAEMGFGITQELVEVVLFDYIKDNNIPNLSNGGVPGRDWWQGFMRCWLMLSERKLRSTGRRQRNYWCLV